MAPVIYGEEELRKQSQDIILSLTAVSGNHPGVSASYSIQHLIPLFSTIKHPKFAEEQKKRLIAQPTGDMTPRPSLRTGPRHLVPYQKLDLPLTVIRSITVSSACSRTKLTAFSSASGLSSAPGPSARMSVLVTDLGKGFWGHGPDGSDRYRSPFPQKVRIRSRAAAVQIVGKPYGRRHILAHQGSAHSWLNLQPTSRLHEEAEPVRGWSRSLGGIGQGCRRAPVPGSTIGVVSA